MKVTEYTGLTLAQQILVGIGVPLKKVLFHHHQDKSVSFTKKGPGRKHKQGR